MNQAFSGYKDAMKEAREAKIAYDANPGDTLLESLFNEKDAIAQDYEERMKVTGWRENIPNVGDVVDKDNYIIYKSKEDMVNKVGGRPIYSSVNVKDYLGPNITQND